IDRLMSDTGELGRLTDPRNSRASRILILADGPLTDIAHLPVDPFELPRCSAEDFGRLLDSTGYSRVKVHYQAHGLPPVMSNESELALVESALSISERSTTTDAAGGLVGKVQRLIWGEQAKQADRNRIRQIVDALVDHVLK